MNYLTEKSLEEIKNKIDMELLKRGFPKLSEIKERENGNGHGLEFHSEPFQTTPVIFKEIWVESFSTNLSEAVDIYKEEEFKVINIWAQVNARYELFDGGSNGCDLFTIRAKTLAQQDSFSNNLFEIRID